MNFDKKKIKSFIIRALVFGLSFVIVKSIMDYFTNKPFHILEFIFYTVFFGCFMAAFIKFNAPKKNNR